MHLRNISLVHESHEMMFNDYHSLIAFGAFSMHQWAVMCSVFDSLLDAMSE